MMIYKLSSWVWLDLVNTVPVLYNPEHNAGGKRALQSTFTRAPHHPANPEQVETGTINQMYHQHKYTSTATTTTATAAEKIQ